ncbi:hypothetical protein OG819_46730 [Streptomyces sp. NBC_01549]|nr:hypothetical protein [Streptomyces sp. NBC_01549]MCX4596869.1 hypothetical protein [Streptomyces sp. NBC_01549]
MVQMASAGAFADAAIDAAVWLSLARASAEQTPVPTDADVVAEHAASHPG